MRQSNLRNLSTRQLKTALLCGFASFAGLAAPASAQSVDSNSDETEIQEIVVTAQRVEQRLIDVPASISVISAQDIEEKGVPNLRDFQYSVPNLIFTGVSSPTEGGLSIRGIAVNAGGPGFESGAGVYIDDVFQGRSSSNTRTIVDVDRVEVLRGPQGTLFGKNTIAGAINIVTIQPGQELSGRIVGGLGNFDSRELAGYVVAPFSETVSGKLVGYWDKRGGFYRNLLTGNRNSSYDVYGGKAQLRFQPTEALTVDLVADYDKTKEDYVGFEIVDTGLAQFSDVGAVPGRRTIAQSDPKTNRKLWGVSGRINYEFANDITLTSISSFHGDKSNGSGDLDRTPLNIQDRNGDDKSDSFAQEIRLSSGKQSGVRYVVGLYYFQQSVRSNTFTTGNFDFDDDGVSDIITDPYRSEARVRTKSYAAFGNAEFNLTDKLIGSAGLRLNYEKKNIRFSQLGADAFGYAQIPDYRLEPNARPTQSDTDLLPTASLRYAVNDRTNIYAKVALGAKSGGWNTGFLTDPNIDFGPEKLINYEVGIKGSAFDRKLTYGIAGFYLDYKDIQVAQFDTNGVQKTTNAGAARSYGIEAEFAAKPVDGFEFTAGVGYTDAKYTDFPTGKFDANGVEINLKGVRLLEAPKWTVNLGATLSKRFDGFGEISFSPEFSYRSSRLNDATRDPFFIIPSSTLVNARLAWTSNNEKFEVTLWADNILNKSFAEIRIVENLFFGPQLLEAYNIPRTYGLRLAAKF
jgi:iron complex outermembrane recepter protein